MNQEDICYSLFSQAADLIQLLDKGMQYVSCVKGFPNETINDLRETGAELVEVLTQLCNNAIGEDNGKEENSKEDDEIHF